MECHELLGWSVVKALYILSACKWYNLSIHNYMHQWQQFPILPQAGGKYHIHIHHLASGYYVSSYTVITTVSHAIFAISYYI